MLKFGIGQSVRRVEDMRFLNGGGRYLDDVTFPGLCHGVPVLSDHAHARIKSIDTSKAAAADGVIAVFTGADTDAEGLGGLTPLYMPMGPKGPVGHRTVRPILCPDVVRCVGDRVAFVVAETRDQARDAAALIEIDYEELPAVTDPEAAGQDGAPQIWEGAPGNLCFAMPVGDKAAVDEAFAKAPHKIKRRFVHNRLAAMPMEPRGAIGLYDRFDEKFTLYTSSQNPHGCRTMLARDVFHIPETKLHAITPDVGGGFGLKSGVHPEEGLVLFAARRIGRPVKYVATRADSLLGDYHGREQVADAEMAFADDGTILAIRSVNLVPVGAYIQGSILAPTRFSLVLIPSVYRVPAIDFTAKAMFTNTSPINVYRGAGRPEAMFMMEGLIEAAAEELGIDPIEMRRRNFIRPDEMPYTTKSGITYDTGKFEETMDKALALADWDGFAKRKDDAKKRGKLLGRGLAYFIEQGGVANERMELRFDPTGNVTIVTGTHSHGQGHHTVYAQLVSEWLGLPYESIGYVQGDTEKVPFGRGTFAARSSLVGGSALKVASDRIIEKAKPMAAKMLEAEAGDIEFVEGQFKVVGTDRAVGMAQVAGGFFRPDVPTAWGVGLDASGSWGSEQPNFPNGCHICEVEIDPETGAVKLTRYTGVDDIGRVINPMICEGQMHGSLAQGIGQALLEHVVFDEAGQNLTGSFMDYTMPRADDFPDFNLQFHEVLCTTNPIGLKAVGEVGTVGGPAAVVSAVRDALKDAHGGEVLMPAAPLGVWDALHQPSA